MTLEYKVGNRHNCLTELVANLKRIGIDSKDASIMLHSFVEAHRDDDEDDCEWDYIIDAAYLEDITMTYLLYAQGSKVRAVLRGPAGLSFEHLREQFIAETKASGLSVWGTWKESQDNAFVDWLAERYEVTYAIRSEHTQAPGKARIIDYPELDDEEDF